MTSQIEAVCCCIALIYLFELHTHYPLKISLMMYLNVGEKCKESKCKNAEINFQRQIFDFHDPFPFLSYFRLFPHRFPPGLWVKDHVTLQKNIHLHKSFILILILQARLFSSCLLKISIQAAGSQRWLADWLFSGCLAGNVACAQACQSGSV